MSKLTFETWLKTISFLFEKSYCFPFSELSFEEKTIKSWYASGETAEDVINYLGNKYNMDKISEL